MAVTETKNPSTLKIKFDCGLDDNSKTIVNKNRSCSNVKADANAQDVLNFVNAIVSIQVNDALEILNQDNTILN